MNNEKFPSPTYQARFGGINRLYGNDAVQLFHHSHIAVVGIGGVGSWAAEALARSGIGTITLIDMDEVCVTNTNRQVHALHNTVGEMKTDVMKARILDINPECDVNVIEDFVSLENVKALPWETWDGIIEATDSAAVKAAIIYQSKRHKKIIITTGAAGGKKDPTAIQIVDICRTTNDPLAAKVRNLLRRHYGFSKNKRHYSIPCVYSVEKMQYPQADGSVCQTKSHMENVRLDCSGGFGAATMVTATFGFAATNKVMEKLLFKAKA